VSGDHIEFEMAQAQVTRQQLEPESEQVIRDRELGTLAELGASHVPPLFAAFPQLRLLMPPQGVQVVAPEVESNCVPL